MRISVDPTFRAPLARAVCGSAARTDQDESSDFRGAGGDPVRYSVVLPAERRQENGR